MSNKIKRGLESNLPLLEIGEPAFAAAEMNVYEESSDGNIKLALADYDSRYYTKEHMDMTFPSQLPFKAAKVLYDSSVDTGMLFPGDVFSSDFIEGRRRSYECGRHGYTPDKAR